MLYVRRIRAAASPAVVRDRAESSGTIRGPDVQCLRYLLQRKGARMAINGDWLNRVIDEFGLSEDRLKSIMGCEKTDVINYRTHNYPIPAPQAELLMSFVNRERAARTKDTRQILDELVQEMKSEDHSFSSNKILGHPAKIAELVADREHFGFNVKPFLVEIHLTNVCSHNCPNCTFASIHGDHALQRLEQNTDRVKKLLGELKASGVRAIFWSGGGEPLSHPDAQEIFACAAELDFKQILITNGSNLNKIDPEFLVRSFSTVRISLDAQTDRSFMGTHGFGEDHALKELQHIHDNIRNLVKAFNRISEPDRNSDMNRIGIGVSFLLQEANKDDILGFCTHARDSLRVRYAEIKPLVHERNTQNDAIITKFVTPDLASTLRILRRTIVRDDFRVFTLENKFLDMISESYGRTFKFCWGHPLYPAITADGGIYPCCLMAGKQDLCFGNVNESSFDDIWSSDRRRVAIHRIDAPLCPINCKLSETNKSLEVVMRSLDLPLPEYLN